MQSMCKAVSAAHSTCSIRCAHVSYRVIALRRQIYQNTRNPDNGHLGAIRFWEQVVADWEKWYEDLEEIEERRGL